MRLILAWELEERCDINLFERLMTYMLVAQKPIKLSNIEYLKLKKEALKKSMKSEA